MSKGTFQCSNHDFSTDDIAQYDKHYAELEHTYDVQTECATGCGERIHIKVTQKLSVASRRIPKGHMCKLCSEKKRDILYIEEKEKIPNAI